MATAVMLSRHILVKTAGYEMAGHVKRPDI
jgi:hypothetical protein